MKNSWLWFLAIGVAVYLYLRSKKTATPNASNPNKTGTAATTTGTATAADPWFGYAQGADTTLKNTTATISSAVNSTKSLYGTITGLFGGSSTSTGKASNPTTNGSGAGVPQDTTRNPISQDTSVDEPDDNIYNGSMTDTESQTSETEDYADNWG